MHEAEALVQIVQVVVLTLPRRRLHEKMALRLVRAEIETLASLDTGEHANQARLDGVVLRELARDSLLVNRPAPEIDEGTLGRRGDLLDRGADLITDA
jgi:hypothetical protein